MSELNPPRLTNEIAPDLRGTHGKAWKIDLKAVAARYELRPDHAAATVCGWIVHAPFAHPAWHSYLISCIKLCDVDGLPPPHIRLEGATHEMLVLALDPDHPTTIDTLAHHLSPANFVSQIIEPSDEAASERIAKTVQDVVDGKLSPDTDYTQHWIARFGSNSIKGDPARAGETRIVIDKGGPNEREIVMPPQPVPKA